MEDGSQSAEALALLLAEAAVARLCHDLAGALGAVGNGLELAATAGLANEAIDLAQHAAAELRARLRFGRALWNSDAPLTRAELLDIAAGLPNRVRLTLTADGLAAGSIPPETARVLLLALAVAAESLRGAGTLTVAGDPARDVLLAIDAPRAAWPAELADLMADPTQSWPDLDPRGLLPRLLVLVAAQTGTRLSFLLGAAPAEAPPPLLLCFR